MCLVCVSLLYCCWAAVVVLKWHTTQLYVHCVDVREFIKPAIYFTLCFKVPWGTIWPGPDVGLLDKCVSVCKKEHVCVCVCLPISLIQNWPVSFLVLPQRIYLNVGKNTVTKATWVRSPATGLWWNPPRVTHTESNRGVRQRKRHSEV